MKDFLANLLDSYSRVARLYPAVLAFLPVVWTAAFLHPHALTVDVTHIVGAGIMCSAGVVLLTNIARSRGKVVEKRLLALWGTWLTTIILRHRDTTVDAVTKGRYHKALQALHNDLALPTAAEESQDMPGADDKYRSATKHLIEQRRDPKYKLVHKENAQYGFRRNLLGLKPLALSVAIAAAGLTIAVGILGFTQAGHDLAALFADAAARQWPYVGLCFDIAYILVFVLFIRPHFVRQAAEEYAFALFKTLE